MYDIVVDGDYAYCLMQFGFQIIDVSDNANPEIIAQVPLLDETPWRLVLSENRVFIAHGLMGLTIIDIGPDHLPSGVTRFPLPGISKAIALRDSLVVVAGDSGVFLIEVSNSEGVSILRRLTEVNSSIAAVIEDCRLYLATNDGSLFVYDIVTAAEPVAIGQVTGFESILDVAVRNNIAYLSTYFDGLRIFDLSDASQPQPLGSLDGWTENISLHDHLVFLDNEWHGLEIIDVTLPSDPQILSTFNTLGYIEGISISGNTAYLADGPYGLQALDFSSPANPVWVVNFYVQGSSLGAARVADDLYISDGWAGLRHFSIADITNPVELNSWSVVGCKYCDAKSSAVVGGLVYVAFRDYTTEHLRIFDFAAVEPVLLADYTSEWTGTLADIIGGDTVLMSRDDGQIVLADFSSPVNLQLVSTVGAYGGGEIDREGNLVLLAAGLYGLTVFDISNRLSPQQLGKLTDFPKECHWELGPGPDEYVCRGGAQAVAARGELALIGNNYVGLIVVDMSDPNNLVKLSQTNFGCYNPRIAVWNNLVFLSGSGLLRVTSISDPTSPVVLQTLKIPGWIYDLLVDDNYLFVAGSLGTLIFSIDIATPVEEIGQVLPIEFMLKQNYPNPFNGSTVIQFAVEKTERVELAVYNVLGQKVRTLVDDWLKPGAHEVTWDGTTDDGSAVASGIYLYSLKSASVKQMRKLVLLK